MAIAEDDLGGNDVFGRYFEPLWFRRGLGLNERSFDDWIKEFGGFTSGFLSVECCNKKQREEFRFHKCFWMIGSDADKKKSAT